MSTPLAGARGSACHMLTDLYTVMLSRYYMLNLYHRSTYCTQQGSLRTRACWLSGTCKAAVLTIARCSAALCAV